jgi:hypothetical protein
VLRQKVLRLALMSPDTAIEDMQRLINLIRKIAEGKELA